MIDTIPVTLRHEDVAVAPASPGAVPAMRAENLNAYFGVVHAVRVLAPLRTRNSSHPIWWYTRSAPGDETLVVVL